MLFLLKTRTFRQQRAARSFLLFGVRATAPSKSLRLQLARPHPVLATLSVGPLRGAPCTNRRRRSLPSLFSRAIGLSACVMRWKRQVAWMLRRGHHPPPGGIDHFSLDPPACLPACLADSLFLYFSSPVLLLLIIYSSLRILSKRNP